MKFHPFAEVFPLLEGDEFTWLVEDIKENGLQKVITLYKGKVLDGRNRFLACQKAKVKPRYHKFDGDDAAALTFVVSANMHRRHLTTSQRAMAAARIATLQSGANQHSEGVPIGTASEMVGASERSTLRARKVLDKGSKGLQKAVDSGEVPVSRAASVLDKPKRDQLKAAKLTPEQKKVAQQVRESLAKTNTQGAVSVVNPKGTEETGKDRPAAPIPDLDAWEPEEDEEAQLEQAEKEYAASIDKVMAADDKLGAAHTEIKRQAAEIASLKLSRNQFQTRCDELIRRIKSLQRQVKKLEKR